MSRDGHADWNRHTAVCARDTCGAANTAVAAPATDSNRRRVATAGLSAIPPGMSVAFQQLRLTKTFDAGRPRQTNRSRWFAFTAAALGSFGRCSAPRTRDICGKPACGAQEPGIVVALRHQLNADRQPRFGLQQR